MIEEKASSSLCDNHEYITAYYTDTDGRFHKMQPQCANCGYLKPASEDRAVPDYIKNMHEKYGYTTAFETPIHPTHKKWLPAAWEIEKIYGFVEAGELSLGKARELTTAVIEALSTASHTSPPLTP